MSNHPEDTLIAILRTSKTYKQATHRLIGAGFTYNKKHYRWEDDWHNWISDFAIKDLFPENLN